MSSPLNPITRHGSSTQSETDVISRYDLNRAFLYLIATLFISLMIIGVATAKDANDIQLEWEGSPHANSSSEAFRHWDKEGEIPADCATCHSMPGFLDYMGADGSASGSVEHSASIDTVIGCDTCHNDAINEVGSVTFPSGAIVTDVGSTLTCLVCHQGRESTVSVNRKLADRPEDTVSAELAFINIHYAAAAASLFGAEVNAGYEYPGKQYATRFSHPVPFNSCTGCHNPHTLSVQTENCSACHISVTDATLMSIRMRPDDVDGDDNTQEGIWEELASLHVALDRTIRLYAEDIANSPIAYSSNNYPYFFKDLDNNGTADSDEIAYPNRYQSWTPRLLRAAYNYQFYAKDSGAWTHNPTYAAQLMIDSIDDLGSQIDQAVHAFHRP